MSEYTKSFYEAYPKNSFSGDYIAKEIIRQTKEYIKGNVLDCCAGSGAVMDMIEDMRNVVVVKGIDLAPTRNDIIEADAKNIPFPDRYFNTVMFNAAIEHISGDDIPLVLSEICRVMYPGGYLIIQTAAEEDMTENIVECPSCSHRFHRWGHVRSYDHDEMNTEISPFFDIVKMYDTYLGFPSTHPHLRHLFPIFQYMGFFHERQYLMCIAKKRM